MKKSELQQIIREEIRKILTEVDTIYMLRIDYIDSGQQTKKAFKTLEAAKKYAQNDFKQYDNKKIKWKKNGKRITSGDLNYVVYDIDEQSI